MSAIEDLPVPNAYLRLMALAVDDPAELVKGTNLSLEEVLGSDAPITVRDALRCLRNLPGGTGRPDFHHRWAEAFGEHFHGPLTAAWLTAPTLGDGIDIFVRFIPDRAPYLAWQAARSGDRYVVAVRTLMDLGDLTAALIELPMLVLLRYVQTMRAGIAPGVVVRLAHAPVVASEDYRARFRAEFRFEQGVNQLGFPAKWRATPNPGFDAVIWKTAVRRCEETSVVTGGLEIVTCVMRELRDAFDHAWGHRTPPTLEDMAQRLNLSVRTLHRRLSAAQVGYQQLVDDARKARAAHLLGTGRQGIDAIAGELGFGNPASFVRAYRRWYGVTPGASRRRGPPAMPKRQLS
ncbi:MAG TPA: AraC family transcriptional regulator ligand-binding domain-containing protein [Gammaproteobacteria bacterium]|nr:AraC family transcriptional regulator ligand-binding domain-containing protein [Gammaproteobacteria bacterium]